MALFAEQRLYCCICGRAYMGAPPNRHHVCSTPCSERKEVLEARYILGHSTSEQDDYAWRWWMGLPQRGYPEAP